MSILSKLKQWARATVRDALDGEPAERSVGGARLASLGRIVEQAKAAIGLCGAGLRRVAALADEMAARQIDLQNNAERALAAGDEPEARKLLSARIRLTERLNHLQRIRGQALRINQELFDELTSLQDRLARARSAAQAHVNGPTPKELEQIARAELLIEQLVLAQQQADQLANADELDMPAEQLAELIDAAIHAARQHSTGRADSV